MAGRSKREIAPAPDGNSGSSAAAWWGAPPPQTTGAATGSSPLSSTCLGTRIPSTLGFCWGAPPPLQPPYTSGSFWGAVRAQAPSISPGAQSSTPIILDEQGSADLEKLEGDREMDCQPPGGFLSYFKNAQQPFIPPPNYHFVDGSKTSVPNAQPSIRKEKRRSSKLPFCRLQGNVLNQSPLFIQSLRGEAPRVHFSVNGTQYSTGYYLADGIYPEWAAFVKTIPLPQIEKHKLFAQHQEGARKDVERAFGVLQSRFNIVRRPARLWLPHSIGRIMKACIILHNMIVEDKRDMAAIPIDLNENPGASIVLPPEINSGGTMDFANVLRRNADIRSHPIHSDLKKDSIEHIWQRFGNRQYN